MATASSRSSSNSFVEKAIEIFQSLIAPVVCSAAVLLLWQIVCASAESKMPGPVKVITQTFGTIIDGFSEKGIWMQLLNSLTRVGIGYVGAAIIGIAIGVAIGVNKFLRDGFDPLIQILRTVPPLAWLPLSTILFLQTPKPAENAGIFLIFITAIWPIIINTSVGVQQIPKDYTNVAKVLRLSGKDFFFSILIPSTVPYIFTGLRIGVGLAWLAIVAAEMLSTGAGGIGAYIWNEYTSMLDDSISKIILAVFSVGLVGLVLDRFVGWLGSLVVSE
jgi:nitrate/nitrite transport system permease protein